MGLKMGLILGLALLMLSPLAALSQPEEEWNRTFGGPGHEVGGPIQETKDGGYVLTGMTESYGAGNGDVWLLKTDSNGTKLWDLAFGGTGIDVGESVREMEDGGYIISGYTTSYGAGGKDVWLINTDPEGKSEWNRTLGGRGDDVGSSVLEAKGGGYIILGCTNSYGIGKGDVWLAKVDSKGAEEWNRTFGGPDDDEGMAIVETKDGGYAIVGRTYSYGSGAYDAWFIKTDSDGIKEWDQTFGGVGKDCGCSVQEIDDGYIVTGFTNSYGAGDFDVWLVKVDPKGKEEWNRTFGTPVGDFGNSIQETEDGGYIIAGCISSEGTRASPDDALLIKIDPDGNEMWQKIFGGDEIQSGISVLQTSDGDYIISGFSNRRGAGGFDFWMAKVTEK